MFTINYGGQNLSVLFKRDDNVLRVARRGLEEVEQISCAIVGDDNIPKAVGSAVRSQSDEPNDYLGMEISLGRALKRLTANKEVRADFWKAFHRAANLQDIEDCQESLNEMLDTTRAVSIDIETPTSPATYESPLGPVKYNDNVLQFQAPTVTSVRIASLEQVIAKHGAANCAACNRARRELADLRSA